MKKMFLFLLITISTYSVANTKIVDCEHGAVTIETNEHSYLSYKVTIHDDGVVNYFRDRGIREDVSNSLTFSYYDNTYNNYSFYASKHGNLFYVRTPFVTYEAFVINNNLRVTVTDTFYKRNANWYFRNCWID